MKKFIPQQIKENYKIIKILSTFLKNIINKIIN